MTTVSGKPLPIEWLGVRGESRFQELCADAMLAANKSNQDVMGWDYLVELPPSLGSGVQLLDQRRAGPTCRVQVKTVWEREDLRAKLSLSSAERLSKPSEPSFICILVVNEKLEFVKACLVHLIGTNLARILKRLRLAEAGVKPKPLNEQTVTFATTDGTCFAPSGANLKAALLSACGSDLTVYRRRKEKELEELGYEIGRYQLKAELKVSKVDEIVDMVLGLRPVTIERAVTTDVRFDTPIQVQHVPPTPPGGKVHLIMRPAALSECTIRVSGAGFASPLRFGGRVYAPPKEMKLSDQHLRIIYRAATFELDVRSDSIRFATTASVDALRLTPEAWAKHFRLLELLATERTNLEVIAPDGKVVQQFHIGRSTGGNVAIQASGMAEACAALVWLLKAAGEPQPEVSNGELSQAAADAITAANRLVKGNGPSPQFKLPAVQDGPETVELQFLLVGFWSLADANYGYAALLDYQGQLAGDQYSCAEIRSKPVVVRQIGVSSSGKDVFVEELKRSLEVNGVLTLEAVEDDIEGVPSPGDTLPRNDP